MEITGYVVATMPEWVWHYLLQDKFFLVNVLNWNVPPDNVARSPEAGLPVGVLRLLDVVGLE